MPVLTTPVATLACTTVMLLAGPSAAKAASGRRPKVGNPGGQHGWSSRCGSRMLSVGSFVIDGTSELEESHAPLHRAAHISRRTADPAGR
jgi:hypothetical protein